MSGLDPADDERAARALLSRIAEPGEVALSRDVAARGAAAVVTDIAAGSRWLPNAVHWQARIATADPARDLDAAARAGSRFVIPGDEEWPPALDDLGSLDDEYAAVPFGLWVRGALDLRTAVHRSVAIVGARASTSYGEYVAGELGIGVVEAGVAVVSGGAYGIDAAAHRGAQHAAGVTVAVLACGVDVAYPRGNEALLARIAENGLIVSEWPPGCAPMRHRFLVRNRVIAALTTGTVVVEAARRSGALSTANRAADLSRLVMAVPGPVTSALSAGTNELLKRPDVCCVTGASDVLELVGAMGSHLREPPLPLPDRRDELSPLVRKVLDAVPARRPAGPASIARVAGVEQQAVARALGRLCADGFVERVDAGWRLARDER